LRGSTVAKASTFAEATVERLREDRRLIVQAAAQAQRAADFILCKTWEEKEETE